MSIAHILCTFDLGGAESIALALARFQGSLGHRVTVMSLREQPEGVLRREFDSVGAETLTVPRARGFDPTLSPRLAAMLVKRGVQVLHTHNQQPLIYGAPAGWLARIPVIHTKHGIHADGSKRRWLRVAAARFVDAFVAVSSDTAAFAASRGEARRDNLYVLPNGVDADTIRPRPETRRAARERLALPQDEMVIGSVGRLQSVKNHRMLLEAAAPLLAQQQARLVLIGNGPEEGPLRALAARLDVAPRVHFAGQRRDVAQVLSALDIFAHPSHSEGHPLAVVEAMAAGLPIVATEVGGIPELLRNGDTALLTPQGDCAAFRQALSILLQDSDLARRLGEKARLAVESSHTLEQMGWRYLNLYATTLRKRNGRLAAAA